MQALEGKTRRAMRKRVVGFVMAVMLFTSVASPALAHSGYISCASSQRPVTNSISPSTSGVHTHSTRGVISSPWLPSNTLFFVIWNNYGPVFWTAAGPGSHSGWVSCT